MLICSLSREATLLSIFPFPFYWIFAVTISLVGRDAHITPNVGLDARHDVGIVPYGIGKKSDLSA